MRFAPVSIATRSGQVVLHELTDAGRKFAQLAGIDVPPTVRPGLEHRFWVAQTTDHLEREGWRVEAEHRLIGGGFVDLLAERGGRRMAVEIETGKSDIVQNINKLADEEIDELLLIATSPAAVSACQRALDQVATGMPIPPLQDDVRLDRVWRFVAAVFLAHAGLIAIEQLGSHVMVSQYETN